MIAAWLPCLSQFTRVVNRLPFCQYAPFLFSCQSFVYSLRSPQFSLPAPSLPVGFLERDDRLLPQKGNIKKLGRYVRARAGESSCVAWRERKCHTATCGLTTCAVSQ